MRNSLGKAALGLVLVLPSAGWAAITGIPNSNVDAFFGSQSDAYQAANPGPPSWPASPFLALPPPPNAYALTGVPGTSPNPNVAPSNTTPFAPSASTSSFNDGFGNTAYSGIVGYIGGAGNVIDDAQIGMKMVLNQASTGYAYEQINYSIDYSLANTPNSAGFLSGALTSLVSRTFSVSGTVGSYVYFGGQMDFWDVPTSGPAVNMGTLTFNYLNTSGGPFGTTVTGSGIVGPGNTPFGIDAPDTLRITGTFLIAGDPSSITVETNPVPVPGAAWLFGSALGLLGFSRRKTA